MTARSAIAAALTAALALVLWAACGQGAPACCESAAARNEWCPRHEVGYLAGLRMESFFLFDALDAHGHDVDVAQIDCETCRSGRFCDEHGMGLVHGLAWYSPLAYELARGERIEPATLECATCRRQSHARGWCDSCRRGMVGHVAIVDEAAYQVAARWFDIALAARTKARECELCAAAMVVNGRCPEHRLSYREGAPVPDPPRQAR